jgi:hypothetical protein
VQGVLHKIFETIYACTYTQERSLDVPVSIAPPHSELARLPFFALTESLTRELLKLRSDLDQSRRAACDSQERTAEAANGDARRAISALKQRNEELDAKCQQLEQQA